MSNKVVIKAEHVTKEYRLGVINHGTLYRDLQSWWAKFRGRPDPNSEISEASVYGKNHKRLTGDRFLALDDVSFEIKKGEIVGVIGQNGAGKSTLLKVLSRITSPTKGVIGVKGRVASLLEVGTGFHPELTGRENIYLNGAILGMRRGEVEKKFDQIVEFSEIGEFIDTPVKRYSSGMYVRLAFSVAAHLESEILLVDEVLAVGDVAFQKKCLGKMEDVSASGRTVLFVSHNMAAIENLCTHGLVFKDGRIEYAGNVEESIKHYLSMFSQNIGNNLDSAERTGNHKAQIADTWISDLDGNRLSVVRSGQAICINVLVQNNAGISRNINLSVGITKLGGDGVLHLSTETQGMVWHELNKDIKLECVLPKFPLRAGIYSMNFYLSSSGGVVDWVRDGFRFQVEDGDYYGTGKLPPAGYSLFLTDYAWRLAEDESKTDI